MSDFYSFTYLVNFEKNINILRKRIWNWGIMSRPFWVCPLLLGNTWIYLLCKPVGNQLYVNCTLGMNQWKLFVGESRGTVWCKLSPKRPFKKWKFPLLKASKKVFLCTNEPTECPNNVWNLISLAIFRKPNFILKK